jgi:D-alanyl-D-alanine carboxypeptidase
MTRLARSAAIAVSLAAIVTTALLAAAGPAAADKGARIDRMVERVAAQYDLPATIYGVWRKGREVAKGAIGEAQPGIPLTTDHHFKTGNVGESMTVTLLLQFVEDGVISLDDPITKWFPNLCVGTPPCKPEHITVGQLANSTSGLVHYAASDDFALELYRDPFRRWKLAEVMSYGTGRDPLFAPGTSWAFSDTNFLLLGQILRKVGKAPVPRLLRQNIARPLGLTETSMRADTYTPPPVMHAYGSDRGIYEDQTAWTLSWIRGAGNVISTVDDLGIWARALGEGSLVAPRLHELQTGDQNVGLGPNTADYHYAMGSGVTHGWLFNNPHIMGYKGYVSYLPGKDVAIVVFATDPPGVDAATRFDGAIYDRIGKIMVPEQPPLACLRIPCPTS